MKICAIQAKPAPGDIQGNIESHRRWIDSALAHQPDLIVFPELSLTGYEPALAKQLAMNDDDQRLNLFEDISNATGVVLAIGLPRKRRSGVEISLAIFRPRQPRAFHSKKFLHPDENPFFTCGNNFYELNVGGENIALAICYELSVAKHRQHAFENGARIYIASVAKFETGVNQAMVTLAETARANSAFVIMANSVGPADNGICGGKSSAWAPNGSLIQQLDKTTESILAINTRESWI